ncbi:XRE family transcriptional regulator [Lactobacillus sp. ESL0679]|uniref:spr1629 family repressor/antitoxin n=1 Tax=Lactobacillus sp. ESL0679 TaxID=2983209 RepID=UPI0023F79C79|nr:XRE family transcriptional regulator [Lactobacillus sp. ESL0679]MDF7682281.1 XRE family transcriptional regulator [Lactobacillus sp. ESL0679]
MFYGEKLSNLRKLAGLSNEELANYLRILPKQIVEYENNNILPSTQTLKGLSDLFHVKPKYFLSAEYLKDNFSDRQIAYRSTDKRLEKNTNYDHVFLNYADYFINYFEQHVIVPAAKISLIKDKCNSMIFNNIATTSIEQIAEFVRQELQFQDNHDLMYIIENSGIYVLEKDLGHKTDAYSAVTKDGFFFIVLGMEKKSAVRRNFDLAHELGHYFLHTNIDMTKLSDTNLKAVEKEANRFAAAFLLPRTKFVADFSKISNPWNPDSYILMKKKYQVALQTLAMRAYNLGLLSKDDKSHFFALLTNKGYKTFEPLDDKLVPIRPSKILSLFKFTLDHDLISLQNVLEQFHISLEFLLQLFNLDKQFFEQYFNRVSVNDSNLIYLNSFR